jgi:leucyl aminopeptidase
MTLTVQSSHALSDTAGALATFFFDDLTSPAQPAPVDSETLRALGFGAKPGEVQKLLVDGKPVFAIGLGAADSASADTYRRAAGSAVRAAKSFTDVTLLLPLQSQAVAEGIVLGSYAFTTHKSSASEPTLATVTVVGADAELLAVGERIGRATNFARDLINEPPSSMTPRAIGRISTDVAHAEGLSIEVWDHDRIIDEQLGGILGVSRGSDEPPRLVKLAYEPENADEDTKTIALVGKGITFDSGGLSLKPADSMAEMKTDMSGAATVLAVMSTLPALKPNVRVLGYLAASENLPGPSATKPGDVLIARNGKTMEVLNTDAEGRLVLADALSLAVEDEVDAIVDIATLTGACKMALGNDIAGLFANDEGLAQHVQASAETTAENVWRLPLHDKYAKLVESNVADIKNQASPGGGGLITSAFFLKEFVGDIPWAHLDVAGTARGDGDDALSVKGGTGYGVRLLIELVRTFA